MAELGNTTTHSMATGGTRGSECEVKSLKHKAYCWTLEFTQGHVTPMSTSEDTLLPAKNVHLSSEETLV